MNINTGFLNLGIFKQNKLQKYNYFSNALRPLNADTVSFSGRRVVTEDTVNTEWIGNNDIKNIITDILGIDNSDTEINAENMKSKRKLSLDNCGKVLEYFGYKKISGQGKGGHNKYRNNYGSIYIVNRSDADPKCVDANQVAALSFALCNIHRTNGELLPASTKNHGIPTEDEIQNFIEMTTVNKSLESNPYRLRFEEEQAKCKKTKLEEENKAEAQAQKEAGIETINKKIDEQLSLAEAKRQEENKIKKLQQQIGSIVNDVYFAYETLRTGIEARQMELSIGEKDADVTEEQASFIKNYDLIRDNLGNSANQLEAIVALFENTELQDKVNRLYEIDDIQTKINNEDSDTTLEDLQSDSSELTDLKAEAEQLLEEIKAPFKEIGIKIDRLEKFNKEMKDGMSELEEEVLKSPDDFRSDIRILYDMYDSNQKIINKFVRKFEELSKIISELDKTVKTNDRKINKNAFTKARQLLGKTPQSRNNPSGVLVAYNLFKSNNSPYKKVKDEFERVRNLDISDDEQVEGIRNNLARRRRDMDSCINNALFVQGNNKNFITELNSCIEILNKYIKKLEPKETTIQETQNQMLPTATDLNGSRENQEFAPDDIHIEEQPTEKSDTNCGEETEEDLKEFDKNISAFETMETSIETTSDKKESHPANDVKEAESPTEVVNKEIKEQVESEEMPEPDETIMQNEPISNVPQMQMQPVRYTSENMRTINAITRELAMLNSINPLFEDMKYEVEKVFTPEVMKELENANNEKFEIIYQSKIRQLTLSNTIKQIKRAMMFAFMTEVTAENKMTPEVLYNTPLNKINNWIKKLSQLPKGGKEKLNFRNLKDKYLRHCGFLEQNEAKQIADIFTSCFKGVSSDDYNNLFLLLKTEGRYFNLLTDKNSHSALKMMLLRLLAKDMDDKCGTDYTSRIEEAKSNLEKMNILSNMDISNSLRNIW